MGETRKTEGDPVCSTLTLLEIISLQTALGVGQAERTEGYLCVLWHWGAVGIPCP